MDKSLIEKEIFIENKISIDVNLQINKMCQLAQKSK